MPSYQVSVHVFDQFDEVSERWVEDVAATALEVTLSESDAELGVVIADDESVRELNRRHRGLDERTDVLSFSYVHQGHYYGETGTASREDDIEFVTPGGVGNPLGEVIVSYPQARRQAEQAGHTVETELAFLLVHGVLHLLGHDHEGPDERAQMEALQDRVMQMVQP